MDTESQLLYAKDVAQTPRRKVLERMQLFLQWFVACIKLTATECLPATP